MKGKDEMFNKKDKDKKEAASIGIIGGPDGPTSIFISGKAGGEVKVSHKGGKTRVTVGKGLFKKTLTFDAEPVCRENPGFDAVSGFVRLTPYAQSGKCSDLEKLIALGLDLDKGMGVMLCLNEVIGYEATPTNAVIFAKTGCDGQHFAFLPNDPKESLDNAKVIAVDPMCGGGYGDAGMNFKDFLRLFITVGSVYFLFDLIHIHGDRERFDSIVTVHATAAKEKDYKSCLIEEIRHRFEIEPLEDLYDYFFGTQGHRNGSSL